MRIEFFNHSNRCLLWTKHLFLLATVFLFVQSANLYAQSVLFVNVDATGTDDGSDWTNAFPILQDALAEADARNTDGDGGTNDVSEIWVATGTYTPDDKSCSVVGDCVGPGGGLSCTSNLCDWNSPREQTFQLLNNVAIYGGFAGTEKLLSQRDIVANVTTLSGDMSNNDSTEACTVNSDCTSNGNKCLDSGFCIFNNNISENSYHVTTGSGTDGTAVIDGFTITAGNADGAGSSGTGGGMYNQNGSSVVTDCTYIGNSAISWGGGMHNTNSSPTVTNCTFSGNTTNTGGAGMSNISGSSPTISNCSFSGNSTLNWGGGMYNWINSNPTVTNCTFSENVAFQGGGGMYNATDSSPTVSNCTFSGNSSSNQGGGMWNHSGTPTLTNCTFSGNSASNFGGGMYNTTGGSPIVTDCTFSGNSASDGGGMFNVSDSSPTVTNCTFINNQATLGGGVAIENNSSPRFTNCVFTGNMATSAGGGIRNFSSSSTLVNCTFMGNTANNGGGLDNSNNDATVINCVFHGNSATNGGGGIINFGGSPKFINCALSGNFVTVGAGGAMYNVGMSTPTLTNCTLFGNTASAFLGGGIYNAQTSSPMLTNCILWGNSDVGGMDESAQIHTASGTPVVNYSLVQGGWTGAGGMGNLSSDPLFLDADGADDIVGTIDDNLSLESTSPAIDAGNNSAVPADTADLDGDLNTTEPTPFDINGNPRFFDDPNTSDTGSGTPPIVDMGAIEFISPILFVDAGAAGADDGTSWTDAYNYLQDALSDPGVTGGTITQIWVAAGTYTPDDRTCTVVGDCVGPGGGLSCTSNLCDWNSPREQTFQLLNNVAIYGGFIGTETLLSQRDIVANETTLSGDLSSNDSAVACVNDSPNCDSNGGKCLDSGFCIVKNNISENSYHVTTGSGTDNTAVIDGFTITAGNADVCCLVDDSGAGMFNDIGSPTVANCIFSGNKGVTGGGMFNSSGSNPTVSDCTFENNSANAGGGMYNVYGSNLTVTNCTFSANSSTNVGGGMYNFSGSNPTVSNCTFDNNSANIGGGIYNESSSPTVTDCTFSGNTAGGTGGGMFNVSDSSPTVTNCIFSMNSSSSTGGGMFNDNSSPTLTNCTFSENSVPTAGGGMFNSNISNPILSNCTFSQNSAASLGGGAMFNSNNSNLTLSNCTFIDNSSTSGGAIYNSGSNPSVIDCNFSGNSADFNGGGMFNINVSSPTVTNCTFSGNSATFGAGMYNFDNSSPTVTDCTFSGNSANNQGGGMYNTNSSPTLTNCTFCENSANNQGGGMFNSISSPTVSNCTFSGNSATYGGGMYNVSTSNPTVTDCTFSTNSAGTEGGGMYNISNSSPTVTNCILWENSDVGGKDESAQIHTDSGTPLVNYSLVQGGWTGAGGAGNIDTDPLFVDADGFDNIAGTGDDNLRLQPTSPAIDAGDNTAVPVDTIDLDNDGDDTELTPWDLDGNLRFVDNPGVADSGNPGPPGPTDRIVDMGAYENGDVPDCNGNDIPDDQDIAGVTSDDCNGNLIPDECELASCSGDPSCSDCNSNGTLDICDINNCAGSPACEDCNLNGVPDSCDIASGTSEDTNSNGIPDECSTTTVAGNSDNWTDNTNWDLGSDYPDNDGHAGNVYVTIDDNRTIFLDDTVEIPALKILEGATLKITQADPGADLLIVPGSVVGDGKVVYGTELVANSNSIDLCSSGKCLDMKILGGGVFQRDANSVDGTSCVGANPQVCTTLETGNLIISDNNPDEGLSPCTSSGGSMILEGDMSVIVNGDFILGSDTSCSSTVAGERLPPILRAKADATFALAGDFVLLGSGTISYSSPEPLIVGCNYDNQSTHPESYEMTTFDTSSGGIIMCLGDPICTCTKDIINCPTCNGGAGYQTFEVAGENLGMTTDGFERIGDTNFSLDRLQVGTDNAAGNVIFINKHTNTIGTDACQEALYVRVLDIKPGSTVTLDNVVVYYDNPNAIIEDHITVDRIGCGDLVSLRCSIETALADPSGINKSRYLSLIPGNNGLSVAIRVRMVDLDGFPLFNGEVRWVGPPAQYREGANPEPKFWASPLECAPHYWDWGSIDLLHLFGSEVVPFSNYEVQLIREDCSAGIEDENAYSESIPLQTGRWGDVIEPFWSVENQGQPNISDVLAEVGKWLGVLNPLKSMAQLQPNIPNPSADISVDDVLNIVDAWLGSPYPYDGPENCPP